MKRQKRFSLAVKVNIVIMTLVISISVLLTLISENTYQETVFRPFFRKLENTEIPADELKSLAQEFLLYLGTEELNQVISEKNADKRETDLAYWLLDKPSLKGSTFSMMDDWMQYEMTLYEIQREGDEH